MTTRKLEQNSGFTLMELIIAIAVILILMAILLPTMGYVRQVSQGAKCLNNLRQIGVAAAAFSAENKNATVPYALNRPHVVQKYVNGFWYAILYYYTNPDKKWVNLDDSIKNTRQAPFFCPTTEKLYSINRICGWNNSSNPALNPFQDYVKRGYGMVDKSQSTPRGMLLAGKPFLLPGGLAKTAYFADGGQAFVPENHESTDGTNFIQFAHRDQCNVLFMDGHVEVTPNPQFAKLPEQLNEDQWVEFFGRPPN